MASYSLRVAMRNQVGVRLPHRSSPAVSFNITRTNLSEVLTIVKGLELVEEDEALLQEIHAQIAKGIWWLNIISSKLDSQPTALVDGFKRRLEKLSIKTETDNTELTEAELAEHHIRIIEFIERIPEYIAYREEEVTLVTQFLRLTIELGTTVD